MCSNVHNPLGTAKYSTSYTKWNINNNIIKLYCHIQRVKVT